MKIAVLSDTHDSLPDAVRQQLAGADEIWHLGDITDTATLLSLVYLHKPLHVVRGNCDMSAQLPPMIELEREGLRFHLTHIPPDAFPVDCDVLLHGHTHVPRNEIINGIRILNPGAVGGNITLSDCVGDFGITLLRKSDGL